MTRKQLRANLGYFFLSLLILTILQSIIPAITVWLLDGILSEIFLTNNGLADAGGAFLIFIFSLVVAVILWVIIGYLVARHMRQRAAQINHAEQIITRAKSYLVLALLMAMVLSYIGFWNILSRLVLIDFPSF